jgi:hypothetical protein
MKIKFFQHDVLNLSVITWCGYTFPGMILLSDLDRAGRLDPSKDMFLHVLTCTSNDFKALPPDVRTGTGKTFELLFEVDLLK